MLQDTKGNAKKKQSESILKSLKKCFLFWMATLLWILFTWISIKDGPLEKWSCGEGDLQPT